MTTKTVEVNVDTVKLILNQLFHYKFSLNSKVEEDAAELVDKGASVEDYNSILLALDCNMTSIKKIEGVINELEELIEEEEEE